MVKKMMIMWLWNITQHVHVLTWQNLSVFVGGCHIILTTSCDPSKIFCCWLYDFWYKTEGLQLFTEKNNYQSNVDWSAIPQFELPVRVLKAELENNKACKNLLNIMCLYTVLETTIGHRSLDIVRPNFENAQPISLYDLRYDVQTWCSNIFKYSFQNLHWIVLC